MNCTKRQIIEQSFDTLGLSIYSYELTPDQLNSALFKLDSMMAVWDSKGIQIGYPLSSSPQSSSLDTDVSVVDNAIEAIYLNLALRIAPSFGKAVARETKVSAKQAYNELLPNNVIERQIPANTFSGAGHKRTTFLTAPDTSPLRISESGQLIFTE